MTQNIRDIFEQNTLLIEQLDKAVICFRRQLNDKALSMVANSFDQIKHAVEAIIEDREYFNLVSTDSVLEMLTAILEAQKNRDYILLTDLLELQLISFLCGVQELIISKEEIVFDEDKYQDNIAVLIKKGIGFSELILEPINTAQLLKSGYRVEFTSSGRMTLAAENEGAKFYFHTNSKVKEEAYLLADYWSREEKLSYTLYGIGMGYHISELHELAPKAKIKIYEADLNVIMLACAFTDIKKLFEDDSVTLVYDPEFTKLKEELLNMPSEDMIYIHYPSYQNIRKKEGRKLLETYIPWSKTIEFC
ncbi:hypothetical protein I5677_16785 [Mobilitalea sibirica]|uniref:Uncharacterized protein n=1 Tax=Mobilitalea sibirica TaxID=1462919 RepID=A0A8J7KXH2_9FIRM|nr:hypothetical protein [Mobilitalea sibirica]MBH1942550.1 hypothetical protein [Mobilitalea sibirica]